MEILELINNGAKKLKSKNIFSHKLDSEILQVSKTRLQKLRLINFTNLYREDH